MTDRRNERRIEGRREFRNAGWQEGRNAEIKVRKEERMQIERRNAEKKVRKEERMQIERRNAEIKVR